jgi:release factor glutamine methyltransferase
MTYDEALKSGIAYLEKHSVPNAHFDAEELLLYLAKFSKADFLMHRIDEIPENLENDYVLLLEQRGQRIPLQHIIGEQDFMGLTFLVNSDVLCPRLDTESVVERALQLAGKYENPKILDLCTGSGCVGISLFKSLPPGAQIELTLADISSDALQIARINAERLLKSAAANIHFLQTNLFENISGTFDMIVTNPPYVPHNEAVELLKDGRSEPLLALDGDVNPDSSWNGLNDGLSLIKRLIIQAKEHLADSGHLLVETGCDNAEETADFFTQNGFTGVKIAKDINGLLRVVSGSY